MEFDNGDDSGRRSSPRQSSVYKENVFGSSAIVSCFYYTSIIFLGSLTSIVKRRNKNYILFKKCVIASGSSWKERRPLFNTSFPLRVKQHPDQDENMVKIWDFLFVIHQIQQRGNIRLKIVSSYNVVVTPKQSHFSKPQDD